MTVAHQTVLRELPSAAGAPADSRPRVLVAPIPVTPTKPLMPSHVKGVLWIDALCRGTAEIATVDHLYGHTTANA